MGIDQGFDIVPRFSAESEERDSWDRFIGVIKEVYKNDKKVEVLPNYIVFKAGEYPALPIEGHKFLRFSAKISGSHAEGVQEYLNNVTNIAKSQFGSRVRAWNTAIDYSGPYYSWSEVNKSFESFGYGVSGKPMTQHHINIAQSSSVTTVPSKALTTPLFEIKEISGKGRALIASVDIPKGTRILCEKPLFTMGPIGNHDELERAIAAKLRSLPKVEQRQFLGLHNHRALGKRYPFLGIFKTNALPCGSGSSVGGVYPTACLINHSCFPNAHNNWNSTTEHETIHAIRPMKAGEEITISYDHGEASVARQKLLKESFGFDCTCIKCSLPAAELQASDARRHLIQRLDDDIGDAGRMMSRPKDSLGDCRALLRVLNEEFGEGCAGAPICRVYYDAFQAVIFHGDQARASVFARRAYEARVVCEGEDSPETVRVKTLAAKPSDHQSFGAFSMKWKTKVGMEPKGLGAEEYEKWLFRE